MNIQQTLQSSGIERLEAQVLLAHVLHVDRVFLFAHPEKKISNLEKANFDHFVERRKKGEPIAYILKQKEFWSMMFEVDENTLIPRPETECLIEKVLTLFDRQKSWHFLELGTGSGILGITLAKLYPQSFVTATDISPHALQIAEKNKKQYNISNLAFIKSHWYTQLNPKQKYDAIISNPPYLANSDQHLSQGDLRFEPKIALAAGETGLEAITSIAKNATVFLNNSGSLFIEHGCDQQQAVQKIFEKYHFQQINCEKDLNHLPRMTFGRVSDISADFPGNVLQEMKLWQDPY